jgi:predicted PurR-regulated permease PerM/CheY-like chemotaxis protein
LPVTNPNANLQRTFYGLALLLMVIAALYWGRSVLLPVALAVLLSFILTPAVSWLERHHFRRLPAVLAVTLLVFAALGGLGYALTLQMGRMAEDLPGDVQRVKNKLDALQEGGGTLGRLARMGHEMLGSAHEVRQASEESGVAPPAPAPAPAAPDLHWVTGFAGSAAEGLATAALVIVLAIFMLAKREDLRDRLIRLFGHGHLTATTRALDEAARRISRYLLMLVLVNACYGTVLSAGLYFLDVPYPLLWGFLAAVLRFIPYVGAWVGAAFPIALSVATAPGWWQPLLVFGMILALELFISNVVEPILYGRSMGVSEVALLVSAAFWAWLWGPVGLVLSVPMTVCLAVLGKYVPQLEFFEVLLRDEPVLDTPVRYYQRLLARDEDEADDMIEEYLRDHPWESVFDEVLLPALALARRDRERGELEPDEQQAVYQATRDVLDDLVFRQQQISRLASVPVGEEAPAEKPTVVALGFPAHDEGDELALRMLGLLLEPSGCRLEVFSPRSLAAELLRRVGEEQPAFVVLAALAPGGLGQSRNVCKRLRAQYADLKVVAVRWGADDDPQRVRDSLRQAGADEVARSLEEARDKLVPLVQVAAHGPAARASARREPAAAAT